MTEAGLRGISALTEARVGPLISFTKTDNALDGKRVARHALATSGGKACAIAGTAGAQAIKPASKAAQGQGRLRKPPDRRRCVHQRMALDPAKSISITKRIRPCTGLPAEIGASSLKYRR
jgi:hypothetical protein